MRKILIGILIIFSLSQTLLFAQESISHHLTELKSKYPYGLLNDDHGILTINDLALNACHIKPEPFVLGGFTPYEYWLCFESTAIKVICEDQHFANEDGYIGRVAVDVKDHLIMYHFFESRPWSVRSCRSLARTLKKIMRGTSHACISASYIDKEEKNEQGQMERLGIFHRLKTKKGCEGEECRLTEKVRKQDCPELKSI